VPPIPPRHCIQELEEDFEARKKLPRLRMRTPMLVQASKLYTPPIFEAFQAEYERSMAACTRELEGNNTYVQPNVEQAEELLSAASLKKKEARSSKRHRSWLDKTRKYKKKVPDNSNVCC
jgi:hypothetical protein